MWHSVYFMSHLRCACIVVSAATAFFCPGLCVFLCLCAMARSQQADQSNERCMTAAGTPGPEMDNHSYKYTTSPWHNKLNPFWRSLSSLFIKLLTASPQWAGFMGCLSDVQGTSTFTHSLDAALNSFNAVNWPVGHFSYLLQPCSFVWSRMELQDLRLCQTLIISIHASDPVGRVFLDY